jgi:hypothetical protein
VTPAELKAKVSALFLETLALTGVVQVTGCQHDVNDVEIVRGNLLHCKCGIALDVPCQHIFVERVLPKVWRCVDCREWRGEGGKA